MKLTRFGVAGAEKPGVLLNDGRRKDLSDYFTDWDRSFFNNDGLKKLENLLQKSELLPEVADEERLGACIARPGKVICIGINYADHAAEAGMPIPAEPVVFLKAANTVVGPNDPIIIPRNSCKTDWEVELGVIIGKDARYLSSLEIVDEYIAGYCISNDVSEREFQLERGGQWDKGKSCDNFNPIGPFMVTRDEVGDLNNLQLTTKVNGQTRQMGNTQNMIFDVNTLVHYLSQFMTLEAGDLITTGTPPGVGMGMSPPTYLQEGDLVELEIDDLGFQRCFCVRA